MKQKHHYHEVILDNASEVSVLHTRFLTQLRIETAGFESLAGDKTQTTQVGNLEGFFDCIACESCPANVLSQADVEDMYQVTYYPGQSYVVHMPGRDIEFNRKGKFYIADFADWIVNHDYPTSFMTTAEREHMYTRKEVAKALEAKEFLKNAGYPSEKEAVHLARDGNIKDMPHGAADIKRYFDIYEPQVEAIRGKTVNQQAISAEQVDDAAREQRTKQDIVSDVMWVADEKFLISLSSPLELTIISQVERTIKLWLGKAMQAQFALLRSQGFLVLPSTLLSFPFGSG